MSKIKLLKDVVDDIRNLADSLETLVNTMESGDEGPEVKKTEAKPAEEKKVTLEEVRAAMTAKTGAGYTADVKALLEKHGAKRLSDINPEEYGELLAEVTQIGREE